ncbi:poly(glycerol-phosphate) alpha-glucosyltransferase [Kaistia sp. 32K]|uniref:glycosyltransferase n=1 Tax=Kaistia sp. 32K TaxID=2795690 RepID=UPI0019165F99|nr:glycosyltransferase [Kaistia sp. 32K]BCP53479.1 poly(glycerol-phosphate) alpha-glucosyltransferase [Kaistia sp. 32K]
MSDLDYLSRATPHSQAARSDAPIHVAMVMGRLSRASGGIFEAVAGLAPALRSRPGIEVDVFGLQHPVSAAQDLERGGVPAQAFPTRGFPSFGYSPALDRALRASSADLLHVHGLWMYPSVAAPRWAAARKAPYIVTPHGQLDRWALAHRRWKKRLAGFAYEMRHLRGASCLHALCEAELASIRAIGLTNPVCVVPNGVHPPMPTANVAPLWRSRVPGRASILLFLGRLAPQKGIPNLLQALAIARDAAASKAWHLVIAGWGDPDYRARLEHMAATLGLEGLVHFVGPQFGEEKARSLAAADAFVLPSLSEGLPIAVLEAWAARLPVLMTPQCNLPEGFARAGAIRILPEPDSIATGLRELFAMPMTRRLEVGMLGAALIQERYTWSRAAGDMESVYRWLLGLAARPATVDLA